MNAPDWWGAALTEAGRKVFAGELSRDAAADALAAELVTRDRPFAARLMAGVSAGTGAGLTCQEAAEQAAGAVTA